MVAAPRSPRLTGWPGTPTGSHPNQPAHRGIAPATGATVSGPSDGDPPATSPPATSPPASSPSRRPDRSRPGSDGAAGGAGAESAAERRLRTVFGGSGPARSPDAAPGKPAPTRPSGHRPSPDSPSPDNTSPGSLSPDRRGPQATAGAVLMVCVNHRRDPQQPSCAARGSVALADRLDAAATARGLGGRVQRLHCLGHCRFGPVARVAPGGRFFRAVDDSAVAAIIDELAMVHARGGSA